MPRLLLLAALVALLAPAALAQTCTTSWTNPAGGSWETAANWDDGVPDGLDTACISLAGTYTVAQSAADRTVGGLVVGGASGTQTLTTFNRFAVAGNSVVRPSGRWELLNRTPGGSDGFVTTGTATIEGVFVHNGGTTLLDGGGTFDVAPGGVWLMRDQASAGIQARPGTFRLRGTLDAAYTTTQTIEVPLDVQGGMIRVSQGRLDIRGGTLANATVDAAAGATLLLLSTAAAPFTVSGTLSGAPAGEVFFNGGTFAATSGEVVLNVGGTGLLLGGSVNLTSGGGTFLNAGRLTHAETGSNFATLNGTTLRNTGQFVLPGRGFGFQNNGLFRNEASGVIEIANGGGLSGVGGADGRVENAGLIVHTANSGGGTGETGSIGVPYTGEPGSILRTETGRLDLTRGGSFRDATFDVPAGTTLNIGGNADYVVTGTLSGTPAGGLFAAGSRLAAGTGGATLAFGGAGLQLSGSAFLTSAGGAFVNTGLLRKADTGSNFSGFRAVTVTNRATVDFASFQLLDGAVLRNEAGATLLLPAGGNLSGNGRLENAGLILRQGNRSGVGGTYSFGGLLRSRPGSEIRSNEDRVDLQAPASQSIPEGTTLTGTGRFFLPFALEVEGTVSPGTPEQPLARLSFFSAFRVSLVSGSPRLVIDVDAGGRSDTLAVLSLSGSGTTRLAGALVVRVRPGYVPALGDQFTVLTTDSFDGVTGQFAVVTTSGAPAGVVFQAARSADNRALVLTAVAAGTGTVVVGPDPLQGGARRSVFVSGSAFTAGAAFRLDCADCLDPANLGSIPGRVVSTADGVVEVEFDLTPSRAFGAYTLVGTEAGLTDVTAPVLVRPYVSFPVVTTAHNAGGVPVSPNLSTPQGFTFQNLTAQDEPTYTLVRVRFPDTDLIRNQIVTSDAGIIYDTNDGAPRRDFVYFFARVPADGTMRFDLRNNIDPGNVAFPDGLARGDLGMRGDGEPIPFGLNVGYYVGGLSNSTFDRAVNRIAAALRNTTDPNLNLYIDNIDAQDPTAVERATAFTLGRSDIQPLTFSLQQLYDQILGTLCNMGFCPTFGTGEVIIGLETETMEEFTEGARDDAGGINAGQAAGGAAGAAAAAAVAAATANAPTGGPDGSPTTGTPGAGNQAGQQGYGGGDGDGDGGPFEPPVPPNPPGTPPHPPGPGGPSGPPPPSGPGGPPNPYNPPTPNPPGQPPPPYNPPPPPPGGPPVVCTTCGGGTGSGHRIRGPWDPNDKTTPAEFACDIGTVILDGEPVERCVRHYLPLVPAQAQTPIEFSIQFENKAVATAPAENVVVTDVLDARLDPATLRILDASHDSTFSVSVSGQTVTFRYIGIMLPPNVAPPEGEGYVGFTVQPRAGLVDGDEIRNTASIVFDFNPPILTPEVLFEVDQVADLAVGVDVPAEVDLGEPLNYTVTLANLGGDPAPEATLTLSPANADVLSVVPSSGTCSGTAPIVCAFGDLAPDAVVTVAVMQAAPPIGTYAVTASSATTVRDARFFNDAVTQEVAVMGVSTEGDPAFPTDFVVQAPRPNPVRGSAVLRYGLPRAAAADVRIYDVLGREVYRVAEGQEAQAAGWHEVRWQAPVASGVYFLRLTATEAGGGTVVRVQRLTVVR